jgi:hypothetical protein
MLKGLIIGIWGCLIAAGSSYAVVFIQNRKPATEAAAVPADKLERRKAPPLTVPVVVEGRLQGYLIVQLALLGPAQAMKAQVIPPEVLMSSEAFGILFSDDRIDFRRLEKYDLKAFTNETKNRIVKRVGDGVVTEVMVDDFNYVSKDDLRK